MRAARKANGMSQLALVESLWDAGIDVAPSTYTMAEQWRSFPRRSYLLFRRYPTLYDTALRIIEGR